MHLFNNLLILLLGSSLNRHSFWDLNQVALHVSQAGLWDLWHILNIVL